MLFQGLITQKTVMHVSVLTPHGSHEPKYPWGNTPEHTSAKTPSQREGDAANWEEWLPWLQLQWHGATWHLRRGHQTTCSTSRSNLIWREKKEISHEGRGIYIFLGNWNKDTIFVLKYRNYTGQRRGVQISLLFISNPGLPWRRVTIQKGKEKEGSGIFHSSVC